MSQLPDILQAINIDLSDTQLGQFQSLKELLIKANQRVNLTSVNEGEIELLHFADSLLITQALSLDDRSSIIDIGTGAGFPGIPLAIQYPEKTFTLVDSSLRKVDFLEFVVMKLALKNVIPIHARAEELADKDEYANSYDLATARALADLQGVKSLLLPFLNEKGIAVAYKGSQIEKDQLDNQTDTLHAVPLPTTDITRTFILITPPHT